jgi:hypothetical protein
MTEARLPKFIVIGAAKAATTWIAHQLRQRPDVFMPGPEPHYFSRCYSRGDAWYASLFAEARPDQLVGEKSADYLADPEVPRRIARLLPNVQLIAQLRNPVERAYSDYCMLFRRGQVDGDVNRYLDWTRTTTPRFLADGLYARHIRQFLDYFPSDQLKLILHDDIRTTPRQVIADVCNQLGLSADAEPAAVDARVNDSQAQLIPLFLRRLPEPIKKLAAPLRGHATFEAVRGLIARPVHYPPLLTETRRRLEDFYREDVAQLGRMLGRDLGGWIEPANAGR